MSENRKKISTRPILKKMLINCKSLWTNYASYRINYASYRIIVLSRAKQGKNVMVTGLETEKRFSNTLNFTLHKKHKKQHNQKILEPKIPV